jgi:hypothetical protein
VSLTGWYPRLTMRKHDFCTASGTIDDRQQHVF